MFQDPGNKGQGWALPVDFPTPGNSKGIHCLTISIAGVIMMVSNLSSVCKYPTWQMYEDFNTNPHHQYDLNNLPFFFGNLFWYQVILMFKILTASTDFPLFTSNMQTTYWLLVNQCTLVPPNLLVTDSLPAELSCPFQQSWTKHIPCITV